MSGQTPYEFIYINSLSGGLNTSDSPLALNDDELTIAYNCILTTRGSAVKRAGYVEDSAYEIASATAIKNSYRFYYGTSKITVVQSNDTPNNKVYQYDKNSGYTEITGGTALDNSKLRFIDYKNWLFMFNGIQCQCWDGSGTKSDIVFKEDGTTYIEGGTNIRCLEICDDRMFIVFEDEPYTLYYSDYGGWDTDPATDILVPVANYLNIPERSRDAVGITGLKSFGLTDELLIFTENDTYVLLGVGATDYSLRKYSGEAGCINQDTIVEVADGTIYFIGNKKIFMTNGQSIVSIGDKIEDKFNSINLDDAHAVYHSDLNLILFFYSGGTFVWNIGTSSIMEQPVFGWTTWNIAADSAIRYTAASDQNQVLITLPGSTQMWRLGGLTDDGEDIRMVLKTKTYDLNMFGEKKTFRSVRTLQDCNTNTPFDVTLDIDDGHKLHTNTMTLPYSGVTWGSTTWNGSVWNGPSRINGSMVIPGDKWGYEFAVKIDNEDSNPLTIHKIAVEILNRNRDRIKI